MREMGYGSARSSEVETEIVRAFQQGLRETGYAEGKNITVEYRWAEGRYDRLPALANELVDRQAAVIVTTGGSQPARAVLAATSTIPLVFTSGSDPVTEVAFLVNPNSQIAEVQMTQMRDTARSIGQAIMILNASTENEIDLAFATLVQRGAGALLMSADTFFQVRREQLVALAARHAVPAMYEWRE